MYQDVIDTVIDAQEAYGFDSLPEEYKVFSLVLAVDSEVNNGGFDQYFSNSSGVHCRQAPKALRAIGAEHHARIVERALTVLGETVIPDDHDERWALIEQLDETDEWEQLEPLNAEFYDCSEDLESLASQYLHDTEGPLREVLLRGILDPVYIHEAEQALGIAFPPAYRELFAQRNGGTHYAEADDVWWRLYPMRDSSNHNRLTRTRHNVVYETSAWRKREGTPQDGVSIAADYRGNALVLFPDGDRLGDAVYRWDHETYELVRVMDSCSEISPGF